MSDIKEERSRQQQSIPDSGTPPLPVGSRVYIPAHQIVGTIIEREGSECLVSYLQKEKCKARWFNDSELFEQLSLPFEAPPF